MNSYVTNFPSQKKTSKQKTQSWYKDCVNAVDQSGLLLEEFTKQSRLLKIINEDLVNGILHMDDLIQVLNPQDVQGMPLPERIQHYDILGPRLDVLIGEEIKRDFRYKVVVINPNSLSSKLQNKVDFITNKVMEMIQNNTPKEKIEEELKKLEKYLKYDFQDFREIRANKIAKYLKIEQKFDEKLNAGFKEALVNGEEIYQCDIVADEPILTKLIGKNVFSYRSGFSNKIQDSDLIVIDDYWSPGKIIDTFYDQLKPSDIEKLERGYFQGGGADLSKPNDEPLWPKGTFQTASSPPNIIDNYLDFASINGYNTIRPYDDSGNIRVLRVYWRGWRQVKEVTFFDEELGIELKDYFPDTYEPDKFKGETAKLIWINEWYEGTKIHEDIYVNLRPKPVQYRRMSNPSICHPGIVGRNYSFNQNKPVSLVDKVKNYLYLYDVTMNNLNDLLQNNHGKILKMDFAMIPAKWPVEQWFSYLKKMKIAVTDSFKEANKGPATGKIAGNLGRGGHDYIDLDQSAAIQQYIGLLEYIKQEVAYVTGVTDQRLGNIHQSETVGGVERSVTQSSHITEWWFNQHQQVKEEVMECLIETAKIAWKGNKKKLQHILDDHSIELFEVDGDEFAESDYGILSPNSTKTYEIEQKIKMAAEQMYSNNQLRFSQLIEIYLSDSISQVKRDMEKLEDDAIQQAQEQQQAEIQMAQEQLAFEKELEISKIEMEQYKVDEQEATKRMLGATKSINDRYNMELSSSTGETDSPFIHEEFNYEKLELDRQKRLDDMKKFFLELKEKSRQFDEKMVLENKKLKVKPKTNK